MTETDDPNATEEPAPSTTGFDVRTNIYRGALGLFALLAVVAVAQLYASVGATIDTFISRRYQPLYRTAFNLVVLLAAGIGISWSVRRLSGE
ncbi:hypothetical protein [Halorussus marinus]|uniref:hypothetical protein n=1 Tax=Halorussus marinus TaxID=2505976 RepID=UPI00106EFD4F|nr:hypothetical protein [Halorussus marinus]